MPVDALSGAASAHDGAPIQVAVSADANFLMPLAVALRSLALAHPPGEVSVTVMHDGLSASDRARVQTGLTGLRLTWLRVPQERLEGTSSPPWLGRAALFRLLLPDLMPAEVSRVIYIDIDTVVTGTLRPLWETQLTNSYAAAVRDAGTPFAAGPYGPDWRALGLEPADPYLNSGVLVIALDAWRAAEIPERALELLRTSPLRWADQDALNIVLRGRWTELPRRWNLQTLDVQRLGLAWALWREDVERALADPAVIHYSDRVKPWHAQGHHPLDGRWYETLAGTAWGSWRPDDRGRPLYRRVGSRTKTAWRVLVAGGSAIEAA